MSLAELLDALQGVRKSGDGWIALCPAHEDNHPSLSITEKDDKLLVYCHAGCPFERILLATGLGANGNGNGHGPREATEYPGLPRVKRKVVSRVPDSEYDYTDEQGRVLFRVVRTNLTYEDGASGKAFFAKRPAGDSGNWINNIDGVRLVPYRLPEVAPAPLVYVVEGEKDVETLRSLGLAATCNPFGAGKWRDEFSEALRNKTTVILPDNDETGRKHAEAVAKSLHGIAKEVVILDLPGLPDKGDVTDFIEAGAQLDDLIGLLERAQPWEPPVVPKVALEKSKFRFTPVSRLIQEPEEETAYLWDQTLPVGGLSICSAKPKVGKSTLARNLAVAIAMGQPFLGRATVKGRVLYLCLEEKRAEIRKHFEKLGAITDDILVHTDGTPENAIPEIAKVIAEFEPAMVIIDPLSRVLRVGDFNDYGTMARGFEPLIDLTRRTGCHILALHHDSKMDRSGGDALLGSTAIFGAVDCHIQLRKRENRRTIITTQRYGEDLAETVIELDKETGHISNQGDLQSFTLAEARAEIVSVCSGEESLTEKQIKERIEGYSQGVISKALREAVDRCELIRDGEGKKNNPYQYSKTRLAAMAL